MKLSFPVKLFLLFFVVILSSAAQEQSSRLLKTLQGVAGGQRKSMVGDYRKYQSSSNSRSASNTTYDQSLSVLPFSKSEDAFLQDQEVQSIEEDLAQKLQILYEIESMIGQDIEANDKILNEGSFLSSNAKKAEMLDRKHDLETVLEDIRGLRLFVITNHVDEMKSPHSHEILPFGFDAFNNRQFQPTEELSKLHKYDYAIPFDYKIGPGDLLEIQMYGQKDAQYSLAIGRNGVIQFPEIGPVNVLEKGGSFQSLKQLLKEKVNEQLGEGVRVAISLGEPRQIKVFLSGEFKNPGQRFVTAGSSLFSLLLDCGGVNEIASLRSLSLKRRGTPARVFDLYDLLLEGERTDADLAAGDVVFLPTVKNRVWMSGQVLRPAIYEINKGTTLADAIELSGGAGHKSLLSAISLERLSEFGDSSIIKTLNLKEHASFPLINGDRIMVPEAGLNNHSAVSIEGFAEFTGKYEWKTGLRISDLLRNKNSYLEEADLNYALIRRQSSSGNISVLSFSPNKLFTAPDTNQDIQLYPKDKIIILSRTDFALRERVVRPLLEELRYEGEPGLGVASVRINGMVHFPGDYPYTPDMTVGQLIVAGGGMLSSAYTLSSELTSQSFDSNASPPSAKIVHINLPSLANPESRLHKLHPRDVLSIKPIPSWSEENAIQIIGEVRFPGTYTFQKNETLSAVFKRAGGFTEAAFPKGAIFTRLSLAKREEEQKQRLIEQLEKDLANISLTAGAEQTAVKAKSVADGLLSRLKNTVSSGRLVIDLEKQISQVGNEGIIVKNGDRIIVPSTPYEVSVVGQVQFATSHLYNEKLSMKDYIQRSGGYTANADQKRVFAVKSNGAVLTNSNGNWFSAPNSKSLEPGDVIVVPINLEKGKWLDTLTSSTQIVYQLAVTAAALNSF